MTKLKNTKKGMAKKALSISLVAAMLATSNVPVWAAEDLFSDGSAAVEAPVVEEPAAEVEAFSSEPTEDTANSVSTLAATDSTYGYTADVQIKEDGNGWAGNIVLAKDPVVKDANGNDVTNYTWTIRKDGYAIRDEWTNASSSALSATGWKIPLDHDDYNHVYDIYIEITMDNGTKVGLTSNAVTVSPVDLNEYAPSGTLTVESSYDLQYTGAEIKAPVKVDGIPGNIATDLGMTLDADSFLYTYSGDLVNVTDKDVEVHAVVALENDKTQPDPAFTGYFSTTYKIAPRGLDLSNPASVVAELVEDGKEYPFTGESIKFNPSDVKVTVKDGHIKNDAAKDISYAVKSVTGTDNGNAGSGSAWITLDTTKLTNYRITKSGGATENTIKTTNGYYVSQEDLTTCTATLKRNYSVAEVTPEGFGLSISDFVFKNASGDTIKPREIDLAITIDRSKINFVNGEAQTGTYADAIVIKSTNEGFKKGGEIKASLTIVANGLHNGEFEFKEKFKTSMEFAGENVAVEQDADALGDFYVGGKRLNKTGANKDYEIVYENNTSAGTAKMIVKGVGAYAGSEKVYEFTINPAPINYAKSDKVEVLYNPAYTSMADYLEDLKLTVRADNKSTDKNTTDYFELKDTDYVISNMSALEKAENKLDGTFDINIEAVKDEKGNWKNYSETASIKGIKVVRKSLSSEDITVKVSPDSYVYTGSEIVPTEVIVTDGDKVLEEGVDYVIKRNVMSNDAVNVGTAKVTVVAPAGSDYKEGSEATGTFTITPADINDVTLEVTAKKGKTLTYDGTKKDADDVDVVVKLGDIDVTKDFDIDFPKAKTENVNAGEDAGKVILTAKSAKAKNYTSSSTTATFDIKQAELNGTLTVYDEAGRVMSEAQMNGNYDGAVHTFATTKFTGNVTSPMTVTDTDYEIVYVDNVYGKVCDLDQNPYGAILVVAKGNYKGSTYTSKTADGRTNGLVTNGVYVDAEGNEIKNVVAAKWFKINPATIAPTDITVNNGVYSGGYTVKPDVTITVHGKTLLEGKDYELDLSANKNLVDVTSAKTLSVTIKPINGYRMEAGKAAKDYTFNWGIDKFDFANATILVNGTDADPFVKVMNGSVLVEPENYDLVVADGKVTVTAKADSKNYTGTKTVDIEHEMEKPEAPVIADVKVSGNKAMVVLSGESDGATGYDYVISTDRDCINNKDYYKVNKNVLGTQTTFTYTQQDTYYAYCHAWKRVNGVKVFSDWSNAYPFSVTAITPEQPVITSVKKSGRNLTVTWTQSANATTGYDIVMGTEMRKVNGELRPVEYGKAVKKVGPNTFSVTFKSIPKGTYYVGLHAHNRTSETGVKVFSPWSNAKKVTF